MYAIITFEKPYKFLSQWLICFRNFKEKLTSNQGKHWCFGNTDRYVYQIWCSEILFVFFFCIIIPSWLTIYYFMMKIIYYTTSRITGISQVLRIILVFSCTIAQSVVLGWVVIIISVTFSIVLWNISGGLHSKDGTEKCTL